MSNSNYPNPRFMKGSFIFAVIGVIDVAWFLIKGIIWLFHYATK